MVGVWGWFQGLELGVWGLETGVRGLGFEVRGLGFGVWGERFKGLRVSGFKGGFRGWGSGFGV